MVQSKAATVEGYLAELPADRRAALEAVRGTILANLPKGYVEEMGFGMATYVVPLSRYPKTYNKKPMMYAALASQKNHMAVYLTGTYGDEAQRDWFVKAFKAAGKKLDIGKSCIRFSKLDDLPLAVIGQSIARVTPDMLIGFHERAHGAKGTK